MSVTLVFFPDTGCLRITDPTGICEELRPPHTWRALASALPGWRSSSRALADELDAVLESFCRERWFLIAARARTRSWKAPVAVPSTAAHRPETYLATPVDRPASAVTGTMLAPLTGLVQPGSIAPANDEPLCA